MVIFVLYTQLEKFWENYNQRIDAYFASIESELQAQAHPDYLKSAMFVSTISVLLAQLKSLIEHLYEHRIGNSIVKNTLDKVLLAPINLCFDVTSVGKILKIFNEEIHTFRKGLW